jgi:histidinol dehydrogenase
MNTLEDLIKQCKFSVSLEVNKYRDVYQTIEEYIDEINSYHENEIDEDLKQRLIKAGCVYRLQFYPQTSIGFYVIYGTSLDEVLEQAMETFIKH